MANKTYSFIYEGEDINGDYIEYGITFENAESYKDACELAENDAVNTLKDCGGHLDIYDEDSNYIASVEV